MYILPVDLSFDKAAFCEPLANVVHGVERTEIKEDCEITSLIGNITVKNGEPYVHLHITVAGKGGNVYGGHLLKTVISATAEIFITVLPGTVERFESDSSPKLNLMKL